MKTLKKSNLEELAKIMPVLSEGIQRMCIGGYTGDSGEIPPGSGDTGAAFNPPPSTPGPLGSINNPYSMGEAEALMNAGHWGGGFVEGMGYMLPQLESTAPSGNKPPIPGFPNFGIQSPGTSGVTGYNPGDSGYTNSNGYGGPTGSFIGTGGGSGGSGGNSGSGSGSSSSEYYDSSMTGSACLPNDLTTKWEFIKYTLYDLAAQFGVNLYNYNIKDSLGRAAYAWTSADGKILVGKNLLGMASDYDRVAVLIHESIHIDRRDNEKVITEKEISSLSLTDNPPEFVKQYAEAMVMKGGLTTGLTLENEMKTYWNCTALKSPEYYENEIATYIKEIQRVPDYYVSPEYSLERKYKLWKYELLLEVSKAYYK